MSSPEAAPQTLVDLVRIHSETGCEGEATGYVRDFLSRIGATSLFDDGVNLASAIDWGPGPALLFCAHHDTVPLGDPANWSHDPLGGEIDGDRLYGRGAADDKGGLAAMLDAAAGLITPLPLGDRVLRLSKEGQQGGLSGRLIIATVREETSDLAERGVLHLLRAGITADHSVVGEPTGNEIALGHRGRYSFRIRTRGRSTHASTPEKGANAVSHLAAVIQALDALSLPTHPILGPGAQAVTLVQGGSAPNVIPEAAEISLDRRPVIGESPESVSAELQSALDSVRSRVPALDASIDLVSAYHPSLIESSEPIVSAAIEVIEALAGRRPTPTVMRDGHTDQEWLVNDARIPTIILGPGSATNIHAPDEFVEVPQVREATAIYIALARRLLQG